MVHGTFQTDDAIYNFAKVQCTKIYIYDYIIYIIKIFDFQLHGQILVAFYWWWFGITGQITKFYRGLTEFTPSSKMVMLTPKLSINNNFFLIYCALCTHKSYIRCTGQSSTFNSLPFSHFYGVVIISIPVDQY